MATKNPELCVIQIGYRSLLLPADKGLKVVAMLQGALECTEKYDMNAHHEAYEIEEPVRLHLTMVRAAQVRRKPDAKSDAVSPRTIGMEPLKLAHRSTTC